MTPGDRAALIRTRWSESHGAGGDHLGAGALYWALTYMLQADRVVVLGSGGAFVPKVAIEAQRQLRTEGVIGQGSTILVDADMGPWGRPDYSPRLWGEYPELELRAVTTAHAAVSWQHGPTIGWLHVDADHSFDGCLADLRGWWPHLRSSGPGWVVTVHDTFNRDHHAGGNNPPIGTWAAAQTFAGEVGAGVVNFPVGAGVAIITAREGL